MYSAAVKGRSLTAKERRYYGNFVVCYMCFLGRCIKVMAKRHFDIGYVKPCAAICIIYRTIGPVRQHLMKITKILFSFTGSNSYQLPQSFLYCRCKCTNKSVGNKKKSSY